MDTDKWIVNVLEKYQDVKKSKKKRKDILVDICNSISLGIAFLSNYFCKKYWYWILILKYFLDTDTDTASLFFRLILQYFKRIMNTEYLYITV